MTKYHVHLPSERSRAVSHFLFGISATILAIDLSLPPYIGIGPEKNISVGLYFYIYNISYCTVDSRYQFGKADRSNKTRSKSCNSVMVARVKNISNTRLLRQYCDWHNLNYYFFNACSNGNCRTKCIQKRNLTILRFSVYIVFVIKVCFQ